MRICSIIICVTLALNCKAQTYFVFNADTINRIDASEKKQGKWVLIGSHKPGTCYKSQQKIEEGFYANNRKSGTWTEYFCNGNIKNQLTFIDGRLNGEACMYREDGTLSETGTWKKNHWVGKYRLYDSKGEMMFNCEFDSTGKRKGNPICVYTEFTNGAVVKDGCFLAEYEDNGKICDGEHVLYEKNRRVMKGGTFKNGKLFDGKEYYYDDKGILTKIKRCVCGIYTEELIENKQ